MKSTDRLVSRELLERISIEAGEVDSDGLHREVSFLLTTGPALDELGHATTVLGELVACARSWVHSAEKETDPQPPAETNPARLRELLLALRNNLAITTDLVDATLAALPGGGAE